MIKNFLNLKGHQNHINGSKVTATLVKGYMLPIGGVASGRVSACGLQENFLFSKLRDLCICLIPCGYFNVCKIWLTFWQKDNVLGLLAK